MFINGFESTTAGNTATTLAQFALMKETPLANSYVTYELIDGDGTVYAQGQGSNVNIVTKPNAKLVESTINVPIPSNIPVNDLGTTYQVRLTLQLTSNETTELYSNLNVVPEGLTYLGSEDVVELFGNKVKHQLVTEAIPSDINPIIYGENDLLDIPAISPNGPVPSPDGYSFDFELDTSQYQLQPSLVPYNIIWQYVINGNNNTESAALYLVTPTVLMAVKDLMANINKARSSIRERPTFSVTDALIHLRQGADFFNAFGHPTQFSMLNATGGVRQYWLAYSQVSALRSQYMFEAESNFDFQGQSIQLSVQREQYYETLAAAIENQNNEPATKFKHTISKRGHVSGDGNVNPTKLKGGAIGTVGATLSPTSRIRPWNPNSWLGSQRSIF